MSKTPPIFKKILISSLFFFSLSFSSEAKHQPSFPKLKGFGDFKKIPPSDQAIERSFSLQRSSSFDSLTPIKNAITQNEYEKMENDKDQHELTIRDQETVAEKQTTRIKEMALKEKRLISLHQAKIEQIEEDRNKKIKKLTKEASRAKSIAESRQKELAEMKVRLQLATDLVFEATETNTAPIEKLKKDHQQVIANLHTGFKEQTKKIENLELTHAGQIENLKKNLTLIHKEEMEDLKLTFAEKIKNIGLQAKENQRAKQKAFNERFSKKIEEYHQECLQQLDRKSETMKYYEDQHKLATREQDKEIASQNKMIKSQQSKIWWSTRIIVVGSMVFILCLLKNWGANSKVLREQMPKIYNFFSENCEFLGKCFNKSSA